MSPQKRWTAEENTQLLEAEDEHPRVIAKKHQTTTLAIVARASRLRQAARLEKPHHPEG